MHGLISDRLKRVDKRRDVNVTKSDFATKVSQIEWDLAELVQV